MTPVAKALAPAPAASAAANGGAGVSPNAPLLRPEPTVTPAVQRAFDEALRAARWPQQDAERGFRRWRNPTLSSAGRTPTWA